MPDCFCRGRNSNAIEHSVVAEASRPTGFHNGFSDQARMVGPDAAEHSFLSIDIENDCRLSPPVIETRKQLVSLQGFPCKWRHFAESKRPPGKFGEATHN